MSKVSPSAPFSASNEARSLRVMTWNILEGFHHPKKRGVEQPPVLDEKRLAHARQILTDHQPDVVILNEALWCRPTDGHYVDYAHLLGYPHAVVDTYDGAWGNAILSRLPVIGQERFRIHNRGGLRATIQCQGWVLEVATYHPHPDRRPFKKAEDFTEILSRGPLDHPFLIAGDFNAISPDDQPDLAALTVGFARFAKEPQAAANRFIEGGRALFPVLQQQGLRDAIPVEQRQFSMPTDLIATDKGSAMRIDHVWVNAHLEVMQAQVIKSEDSNHASDHHPIIVDLAPVCSA